MGIIQGISDFFADLLGCEDGDTACEARAKKYGTWAVLVSIIVLIALVAPKIYRWYKPKGGK